MTRTTLRRTALIFAAAALFASGCKNPVAPQPSDSDLTAAVQSRLAADPGLAGQPIHVTAASGVVTLNGAVDSIAVRSLAADDATQINGVKVLNNNLTVTPPNAATAPVPAPTPAPAPATPAPPPPPPVTVLKTFTAPVGSSVSVRLTETLSSASAQPGSAFHGTLANDITDGAGVVLYPVGCAVTGQVTSVQDAAHFKGSSLLSLTLTSLTYQGNRVPLTTDVFSQQGQGRGKNTAEKVGGGAAVGAVLGGIFGGGKGAGIGALAGGALGAGAQAATKGQEVNLPSETTVRFRLASPVSVTR